MVPLLAHARHGVHRRAAPRGRARAAGLVALCLAASCARPPPEPGKGDPRPEEDTSVSSPPTPIGETGTETDPYLPAPVFISPSVHITGREEQNLGTRTGVLGAHGSDPGLLLLDSDWQIAEQPLPTLLVLAGPLPLGDWTIDELWDGVSGGSISLSGVTVVDAGDVNDDGHEDAWLRQELFHGPLTGRSLDPGGGVARILEDDAQVMDGNFDANGDGVTDVLASRGWQSAAIYYGPFAGDIEKRLGANPNASQHGNGVCPAERGAVFVPDAQGPGRGAVVTGLGVDGGAGGCTPPTAIFDASGPPGTVVSDYQRLAGVYDYGYTPFDAVGDLDGDGYGDLAYGERGNRPYKLLAGPFGDSAHPDYAHDALQNRAAIEFVDGWPVRGLGDINGDGVEDLLTWTQIINGVDYWSIALSPYQEPVDGATALPLVGGPDSWNFRTADLDGDGLSDVVCNDSLGGSNGDVRIWYATDLLAAAEAWKRTLETAGDAR